MTRSRNTNPGQKRKRKRRGCADCINGKCDYCIRGVNRRDARRVITIDPRAEPIFITLAKALGCTPKRVPR